MTLECVDYPCGKSTCKGFFSLPEKVNGKVPAILLFSTWFGLNQFAKEKAQYLSNLGYMVLGADLYGNGAVAKDEKEAAELMQPLYQDRTLLRERLLASYTTLTSHPFVDVTRIGAIGFCFGGLSVIELIRSGVDLKGGVSFHGALSEKPGTFKPATKASKMHGSLLVLTGAHDPLATMDDLSRLQHEMTERGIDWQTHIFGAAGHSFTNQDANKRDAGFYYDALSARRSFLLMEEFFKERFK